MEIIKKVIVKQVLTESSKGKLREKFNTQQAQTKKEIEQLRFELKKYEKQKRSSTTLATEAVKKEIRKREEKEKLLSYQLEQLEVLPIGSEIKESEMDAIITINIGENWDELMKNKTIIIKDGIVHEIR